MTGQRRIARSAITWRYEIKELLQAIFACELLVPSDRLWLVSPWISDVPVIDNRAGRFEHLVPTLGLREIRLAEILNALAKRGTKVTVVVRPVPENASFLSQIQSWAGGPGSSVGRVRVVNADQLHEKGLLGQGYHLSGSMNFTNNGIELLDESVLYQTNPEAVGAAGLDFEARWATQP